VHIARTRVAGLATLASDCVARMRAALEALDRCRPVEWIIEIVAGR
jgi:hypothetical protein